MSKISENGTSSILCPLSECSIEDKDKTRFERSPFRQWRSPDTAGACTFSMDTPMEQSPHRHVTREALPKILPNALYTIGNTPMIRLSKIAAKEGIECELVAKCEQYSAGGSVKDRLGLRMIEDAEAKGIIKPGDVLVEPSSGNTGIGFALVSAVKGYRCIVVMPDKYDGEKVDVLKALGAEVVLTKSTTSLNFQESNIGVAHRLMEEIPNAHMLNQLTNASNPIAHFDNTADEILDACDGKIDMLVACAGTGGTITGLGRKIKMKCPNCKVIAVDPVGSMLAEPEKYKPSNKPFSEVEGIGSDFLVTVLSRDSIDKWYRLEDKESFNMARRLIREEGLLVGASSGSAVFCAIQAIKDAKLKKGDRCVVLLPESIRNYMNKFIRDDWMIARDYLDPMAGDDPEWWWDVQVSSLHPKTPRTVLESVTIQETLDILNKEGLGHVAVVDGSGDFLGMVSLTNMMTQVVRSKVKAIDPVSKVMQKRLKEVTTETRLKQLSRILDMDQFVLVIRDPKIDSTSTNKPDGTINHNDKTPYMITRIDLLNYIITNTS